MTKAVPTGGLGSTSTLTAISHAQILAIVQEKAVHVHVLRIRNVVCRARSLGIT